MSLRSYTLSLSRWHHVADRIRQIADSKSADAFAVLSATHVGSTLNDTQRAALAARGAKSLESLEFARKAQSVLGTIRQTLAVANAKAGVTAVLAEADGKRRLAALLRKFAAIDLVTKVQLDGLNAAIEQQNAQARGYGRNEIAVSLIDAAALDALAVDAQLLESEVAALTDKVADLNRTTVDIELPIELAQAVGL